MTQEKTKEESSADVQERIKQFNAELIESLGKYKLGLGAQPVLVPSKDMPLGYVISAKPILFDDSKEKKQAPEGAEPLGEKGEVALVKPEE